MSLEPYVSLGRAGLRVSPLCLGTMTFGQPGWGTDAAASARLLDHYLDHGGNFVDTANNYARGWAEKLLGDHLAAQPSKRQRLVLATKFVASLFPGDPNAGGAGRKALHAQLDESLRRLRTDHVDLYWMHLWDPHTPIEETLRALDDLVRAGKVRYVGFSNTPAWKVAQAQVLATLRGWTPLVALQLEYSLLERTAERELLPAARELGLGIAAWSPLKNGVLSGKYTRALRGQQVPDRGAFALPALAEDRTYDVLDALTQTARALDATPSAVALAWALAQPGISSAILGVRSIAQLDANLAARALRLPPEHLEALSAASKISLGAPHELLGMVGRIAYGGTTVDGVEYPATPYAPRTDAERA